MKRKKVLALVLCAAMTAMSVTGCGGNSQSGGQTTAAQQEGNAEEQSGSGTDAGEDAASAGGQNIIVWTQFMDSEAELLQKYADQWGAETGNTVSVIPQQTDIQQFSQAANSADGPDGMLGIPNDQLANYVSANLAQEVPANLYEDADFVEAAIVASSVDGKKYGVPLSVETPFLFYNTDKVSEVPAT